MRRIGIIWFLLLLVCNSFAQNITELNSDSAIKSYIIKRNYSYPKNFVWAYFDFTNGKEVKNFFSSHKGKKAVADSISGKRWMFQDINTDGKTDLIVSGVTHKPEGKNFESTYRLLVFLAEADNSFKQIDLVNTYENHYPVYFNPIKINGNEAVELTRVIINDSITATGEMFTCMLKRDTLIYFADSFVENNELPSNKEFQSLTFYISSTWSPEERSTFMLDVEGKIKLEVKERQSINRKLQYVNETIECQLEKRDLKQFIELLNYVSPVNLDTFYSKAVFDISTYHLNILYKDGTVKKIADYGGEGTFGLRAIFTKIDEFISRMKMPVVE